MTGSSLQKKEQYQFKDRSNEAIQLLNDNCWISNDIDGIQIR